MDTQEAIVDGVEIALSVAGFFFPAAGPLVSIVKDLAPQVIPAFTAAKPFIAKAIKDGRSAIEAANEASPGLGDQLRQIVVSHMGGTINTGWDKPVDLHLENLVRVAVGFGRMSPEEEKVWMDRATPCDSG